MSESKYKFKPSNLKEWKSMIEGIIIDPETGETKEAYTERMKKSKAERKDVETRKIEWTPLSSLTLRQVGGWDSASQVSHEHFLLTRAVWEFHMVKGLKKTDFMEKTKLLESADDIAQRHLSHRQDWKKYRQDIKENKRCRPAPGKGQNLGAFTTARYWQLAIPAQLSETRAPSPISSRLRSSSFGAHTTARFPSADTSSAGHTPPSAHGSEPSYKRQRAENDTSSINEDMDMDLPGQYYATSVEGSESSWRSSLPLNRIVSKCTQLSISRYPGRSPDEELVNMALCDFLIALTLDCKEVLLDWESTRHSFEVHLGKARLMAKSDGRLCSRDRNAVYAIIEVKPFDLNEGIGKTLRQMTLEMVAWISHRVSKGDTDPAFRYYMISEHHADIFLTMAEFDDRYIAYLQGDREDISIENLTAKDLLKLHCYGPMDIFSNSQVTTLGLYQPRHLTTSPILWKAKITRQQNIVLDVVFCVGFIIIAKAIVRAIEITGRASRTKSVSQYGVSLNPQSLPIKKSGTQTAAIWM
ncbi:hypothetical protein BDV39DRAFT_208371 [Aspergillus sergii]|uniref:Uncharacterized protein n=1 Tax=Aspergillus sergii TaxID=1034303 RepID=A0A5N6WSL2_9EURO|nr:hypothetical protein BDV39DRAFT_208371 [Aspergillus sergii]